MKSYELFLLIPAIGTSVTTLGIIFYITLISILNKNVFLISQIGRFIYSVCFSVAIYSLTYYILNKFNWKFGFTDTTPVGIVSTIIVYIGTTFFTKNIEL